MDGLGQACLPQRLHRAGERVVIVQFRERLALRLALGGAVPAQFGVTLVEVLREFLDDLGFALGAQRQLTQPFAQHPVPVRHGRLR